MMKLLIIVEETNTGFSAYSPDLGDVRQLDKLALRSNEL